MKTAKGLHEIMSTRLWDMHPEVLSALRSNIYGHIAERIPVDGVSSLEGSFVATAKSNFQDRLYLGDAEMIASNLELDENDRIINVLSVEGAITRDGGGCSYGSREQRDWLLAAADMDETIGHILIINSGGGSAASKYDYEQALDYIRAKGQKVIAFIDGMACSAAYALACMADEVYVMNENNQIGCIGTMCAFYTQRHGDVNAITKERYVELYADGSPYKNREFRAAVEEDYNGIVDDLNQSAEDFKALVRMHRPQVTEEQLLGDTYNAGDVIGTLVDGQKTFEECVERLLEISGHTTASVNEKLNEEKENEDINSKPNYDMSKEYPLIMAAVQAPTLESDQEDAVYLHKEFCENLEARLAAAEEMEKLLADKSAELDALTENVSTMEAAHAEAIEKLNAEHADMVEALKIEHEAAIEKLTNEHMQAVETLNAEHAAVVAELADKAAADTEAMKAAHENAIAELNEKLAAAEKAVAEKEAELAELADEPAANAKGEAPTDNAAAVSTQKRDSLTAVKPGMTAKERREALRQTEMRLVRNM